MSYKSLLFCADESSAQAVTQILTELEFAVEAANEPFAAVKKLSEEQFDALVVDCHNDQDAALLFRTARDSAQNHSSLSVAVVEGQVGVAKAFRIGANLVLTKPINIEQAKGTLRVARGLLRKHEAKPATQVPAAKPGAALVLAPASAARTTAGSQSAIAPSSNLPAPASSSSPQAPASFSALEVETDPAPATGAAELAVLESLPDFAGNPALPAPAAPHIGAQPVAATASGQAAAVAPALEKAPTLVPNAASAAPMVTNDPIVADKHYGDPLSPAVIEAPNFLSLEKSAPASSSSAVKFFKLAFLLAVLFVVAYFGWQRLQPMQYLQLLRPGNSESTPSPEQHAVAPVRSPTGATASNPAPVVPSPSASSSPALSAPPLSSREEPAPAFSGDEGADPGERGQRAEKIETIEVKEMPMPGDPKPGAPKVQPLLVKPDSGSTKAGKPAPTAPPVQVSEVNIPAPALPDITRIDPALPKLVSGTMRVSQGVSQGLILKKIPPIYPPTALQFRKEGSVELLATISKQGSISDVHVLSGDSVLAKAAVDAVRQWKYRPYLLNGEPVAIQTQITIVFKAPH